MCTNLKQLKKTKTNKTILKCNQSNQIIFNSQNFNKDFKPKADVHQQMFINIFF